MNSGSLTGKRIGLLTASASRAGGGVFEAVATHSAMIAALGATPVVVALNDDFAEADRSRLGDAEVFLADVRGPRQIGYAPGLVGQLHDARLDLLHLHGIWMYPSRAALSWKRGTGRPYLISPHGMLEPWITSRGVWKKRLARIGYERASWSAADGFHALTGAEARDIAAESGRTETLIIPNAGPRTGTAPSAPRAPNVVYIGRIHAKKNLAGLIEGWCAARRPAEARLTIAGWGDAADIEVLSDLLAKSADPAMTFIGPVFGEAKQHLLESASFLILPSFSEGLPMAILEAWAAGTPTIMSEHCNLAEGLAQGAALRCDVAPRAIAQALETALALDRSTWLRMARAAHALSAGPFSAGSVASRWHDAYSELLAGRAARTKDLPRRLASNAG